MNLLYRRQQDWTVGVERWTPFGRLSKLKRISDDFRIWSFERTQCLVTKSTGEELDNKFKPQGVTVSFKVPTEAPPLPLPLKLNVQEEVVGTSTTYTRTTCNCSSMDQYIEKDKNEIGDETNDDIFLEREEIYWRCKVWSDPETTYKLVWLTD